MAVMICVCIVSIALVNHAMMACFASATATQSRYAFECRQAATDRLSSTLPDVDGGSLAPYAPVTGYSDTVYLDPETGALVDVETSPPRTGAGLIRRQWRLGSDAGGNRVFEVSAVALDLGLAPRRGPLAASVVLSKRVS